MAEFYQEGKYFYDIIYFYERLSAKTLHPWLKTLDAVLLEPSFTIFEEGLIPEKWTDFLQRRSGRARLENLSKQPKFCSPSEAIKYEEPRAFCLIWSNVDFQQLKRTKPLTCGVPSNAKFLKGKPKRWKKISAVSLPPQCESHLESKTQTWEGQKKAE